MPFNMPATKLVNYASNKLILHSLSLSDRFIKIHSSEYEIDCFNNANVCFMFQVSVVPLEIYYVGKCVSKNDLGGL